MVLYIFNSVFKFLENVKFVIYPYLQELFRHLNLEISRLKNVGLIFFYVLHIWSSSKLIKDTASISLLDFEQSLEFLEVPNLSQIL